MSNDTLVLPEKMVVELNLDFYEQAYNLTRISNPKLFKALEKWVPQLNVEQKDLVMQYIKDKTPDADRGLKFMQCAEYMFYLVNNGMLS